MTPIVLGALSAFLFGAMTVFVRIALRSGVAPEAGTLFTILPALAVTAIWAAARGEWDVAGAWPFLLAGLLAPGISQILFTFAVRDAGASRTSVAVGTAPLFAVAIALVFLDEPLVAGLIVGAALIVAGGILLVSERARPDHFRRLGLVVAIGATVAFATRDNVIRWLGTEATDVEPGLAAFVTVLAGAALTGCFVAVSHAPLTRRAAVAFLPAALCYGVSYVLLFEAFYRGRVSVVSPIVATESLWGVTLSWLVLRQSERVGLRLIAGAALVVAGGVLIGVYR
ncbi:MAG: DMT family transporter [Thermoleophilia bacterium]|nr:DMT family transporter [Thermoleophilia bacterium]MDH4339526.1 DMT family transporter [Thermoleophilia bacterium]